MVVLAVAAAATGTARAADRPPASAPRITIAVLPQGTTIEQLAAIRGMAIGLMSAGIGSVSAPQTYLDIGQGARVPSTLYDEPLPTLDQAGEDASERRIDSSIWERVRGRAEDAPADLVPGLLGSTLESEGVAARYTAPQDAAALILVDRSGALPARGDPRRPPEVVVTATDLPGAAGLARDLGSEDLVIAMERGPAPRNRALAIGVAGGGFSGMLTSESTRMRGYVLSTDVAPTILDRMGLPVPDQMSGQPVGAEGIADPAYLRDLGDRLAVIVPRRSPVIGTSLLVWLALCAAAGINFGLGVLRGALAVFAVSLAYLPAVLLITAALEPSELVETLIVGIGSPVLALATLGVAGGFGGLAIAGAASVAGYGIDVLAGSHLTELSLIGPNPIGGSRFYGIGNELEATVGTLVPLATGAGLAAWASRVSSRTAAIAFAATAAIAVAIFAPGRFGADVGAAITLPVAAAVAAGVCLGTTGRRLGMVIAAPVLALAALLVVDLVTGGNAHLTRSVLDAGGFDGLSDVAERRLELSVESFGRYAVTPMLWIAAAIVCAGLYWRGPVQAWFGDRRWAWAGLAGATAATLAGTLANDSGALVLVIGATLVAATAGLAWATRGDVLPDARAGEEGT